MSAADALAVARAARPRGLPRSDHRATDGCALGDEVCVIPLEEDAPARGRLLYIDSERVVLGTDTLQLGALAVHFPRLGYRLSRPRQ